MTLWHLHVIVVMALVTSASCARVLKVLASGEVEVETVIVSMEEKF